MNVVTLTLEDAGTVVEVDEDCVVSLTAYVAFALAQSNATVGIKCTGAVEATVIPGEGLTLDGPNVLDPNRRSLELIFNPFDYPVIHVA